MTPFICPITPDDVAELIDFTVADNPETASMARMQREGVAALYNILCKGPVAYLADEVGMGKTYQALGLAALVWSQKPGARILFVSPRQNLQEKWIDDYKGFFTSNYRRQ
jgi:superfamily II DNA or RNA helicase